MELTIFMPVQFKGEIYIFFVLKLPGVSEVTLWIMAHSPNCVLLFPFLSPQCLWWMGRLLIQCWSKRSACLQVKLSTYYYIDMQKFRSAVVHMNSKSTRSRADWDFSLCLQYEMWKSCPKGVSAEGDGHLSGRTSCEFLSGIDGIRWPLPPFCLSDPMTLRLVSSVRSENWQEKGKWERQVEWKYVISTNHPREAVFLTLFLSSLFGGCAFLVEQHPFPLAEYTMHPFLVCPSWWWWWLDT